MLQRDLDLEVVGFYSLFCENMLPWDPLQLSSNTRVRVCRERVLQMN